MGIAAGTANHAAQLFQGMGAIMHTIPGDYADNYKKKTESALNMSKMATDKAKTVFFETIPEHKKIKTPDAKNFVKFDDSCKEDL